MKIFLTLSSLIITFNFFGQAGDLDTSFNSYAYNHYGDGTGFNDVVNKVIVQPDQKIIVAGNFTDFGSFSRIGVARLNADGGLDLSFHPVLNGSVITMALQPDGKIIITGDFTTVDGASRNQIARLNADGTLDTSFNPGTGIISGEQIKSIALQADNKIVIGGYLSSYNGTSRNSIARLNTNGSLDASYNLPYATNGAINSIAIQNDGKIVFGGNFSIYASSYYYGIARTLSDGTVDLSFNIGSGTSSSVFSIVIQNDQKIIAGGLFSTFNGQSITGIIRLNTDGTQDTGFNSGTGFYGYPKELLLQSNGQILACGTFQSYNGFTSPYLVRINADGSADQSITSTLPGSNDYKNSIALQSNGNLIIGGNPPSNVQPGWYALQAIMCLTPTWSKDATFFTNPGANPDTIYHYNEGIYGEVKAVATQPDGKITIGGSFTHYNTSPRGRIARLLPDGTNDPTFNSGTGFEGEVNDILRLPNGQFLVGGNTLNTYNGVNISNIVRLNADGTRDASFNPPFVGIEVIQILRQSDGKILLCGQLDNQGSLCQVMRLTSNGNIDGTFTTQNLSSSIDAIALQNDGKIIVTGYTNGCIRLNTNGTIDASFVLSPALWGDAHSVTVLSNGKILLGGSNLYLNGGDSYNIARYNSNGTEDATFSKPLFPGSSTYNIEKILIQPDGKILMGGIFHQLDGFAVKELARLNVDGTVDTDFHAFDNPQSYYNRHVNDFSLQQDGSIVCAGMNFFVNGYPVRKGICRLGNDTPGFPPVSLDFLSVSPVSCSAFGTATAHGYDGPTPYTYQWLTTPASLQATKTFSQPGVYTCVVTDADGLKDTASLYISGPEFTTGFDLQANEVSTSFRPDYNSDVWIDAFNGGCVAATGQVKYLPDTLLSLISSNPAPDVTSGDTLIWNFTGITVSNPHLTIHLEFQVSQDAVIGDVIDNELFISPITGDADTTNNYRYYTSPVINGYDPNDKKVYPEGECIPLYVDRSQPLTYTVRFQNTGNAEAINIVVEDTMDTDFSLSSLRVLGKSHPMTVEPEGRVIRFKFNNINLPDSTSNPSGSNGYVIFEIKPVANKPFGTLVKNRGSIYFDSNPAIITNQVVNTLSDGRHSHTDTFFESDTCSSYTWNGQTYLESGTYFHTTQTIYGCDSIATLHLQIGHPTTSLIVIDTLDSYELNGEIYTVSGTYTQVVENSHSCDSTITLQLNLSYNGLSENTVNNAELFPNPTHENIVVRFTEEQELLVVICDAQSKELERKKINGQQATIDLSAYQSGIYMFHFTDSSGKQFYGTKRVVKL